MRYPGPGELVRGHEDQLPEARGRGCEAAASREWTGLTGFASAA